MTHRLLTAVPVFNEVQHVASVLGQIKQHADDVLVINDGSTDGTAEVLARVRDVTVVNHSANRGYGAALSTAFEYAQTHGYDILVTTDCDGQHQPRLIHQIADRVLQGDHPVDMVSGSRFLQYFDENTTAPEERRLINQRITRCLNEQLGLSITDAFCGFKAYRVDSLKDLEITDPGYAMPLQLWVQAVDLRWTIEECPVPLVYLDLSRSFGGSLDDAEVRLTHYRDVLNRELERRGMSQRFAADCGQEVGQAKK